MSWLFGKRAKKLKLRITPEMELELQRLASEHQLGLAEVAERALALALRWSTNGEDRRNGMSRAAQALAFRELDEIDRVEAGLPAASTPVHQPRVVGHPCYHLTKDVPRFFTSGECQGTCCHPAQRGKPCCWGPHSAQECPSFSR